MKKCINIIYIKLIINEFSVTKYFNYYAELLYEGYLFFLFLE